MNMRIALIMFGIVLLVSPLWADVEVTADFTDGNDDTTYVDAYHGIPGDGWTSSWEDNLDVHGSTGGSEIVTNTVTDTNPIFEAGNKYLSSTVDANGVEEDVRFALGREHLGGMNLTGDRTIEFTFRLDEDVAGGGSTFTEYQDRYMIFDSIANRNTASAYATWSIFGYANTGTYCPEGRQMEWTFVDGTNDAGGSMAAATFADTDVPLVGGAVYDFSISLDTVTETWNASVSTTIDTVEYSYDSTTDYPTGMGWRYDRPRGGYAYFSSRAYSTDDVRAFSVDGISVVGKGPPGDMPMVEARFTQGNTDTQVDGYPGMRGNGWNTAWEYGASEGASATLGYPTVVSTSPLKPLEGSGNYLQVDTTHEADASYAGVRRSYKLYEPESGLDWSKKHTVEFTVRIDEDLGGYFDHVDDRYQFSGEDGGYNSGSGSTWMVACFGGFDDIVASTEDVGVWVFYDGDRIRGDRDTTRNVESDIDVVTGMVYDFTIVVDPATQSYIATVSDGADSFTTGTLGWWTDATEIGGYLMFDTRAGNVNAFDPDHRIFSLDDVVITQSLELIPGDTNEDGDVDADDLATLAGNWGASVTPGDVTAGDFDGDGIVGPEDASILAAHWGHGTGEASGTSVPEPCMAMLVGIGLAMLAIRRTRR